MSVQNRRVDVTQHARTRWLQRVAADDPYPGTSVREAFKEASHTDAGRRIRGYHDDLGVLFVAVESDAATIIVTVYETANGRGGQDG
jgi:hypothetical protein